MLLDDYTFRRIDKFTGAEGTWQEWSFNVLMTVTQVDAKMGDSLEDIKAKAVKPMTGDMFKDCLDFEKLSTDDCEKFGPALYGVLCSLTWGGSKCCGNEC